MKYHRTIRGSLIAILAVYGLLWMHTFIAMHTYEGISMLLYLLRAGGTMVVAGLFYTLTIRSLNYMEKRYKEALGKCRALFVIYLFITAVVLLLYQWFPYSFFEPERVLGMMSPIALPIAFSVSAQALREEKGSIRAVFWTCFLCLLPLQMECMAMNGRSLFFVAAIVVVNVYSLLNVLYRYIFLHTKKRRVKTMLCGILLLGVWMFFCFRISGLSYPWNMNWNAALSDQATLRKLWQSASIIGGSPKLQTEEMIRYLSGTGNYVSHILYYAGKGPAVLFLVMLPIFWNALKNMVGWNSFQKLQYQSVYVSAFLWLSLRIMLGFLSAATLIPEVWELPFQSYLAVYTDSIAVVLMFVSAVRKYRIEQTYSIERVSVTDYVDPMEYYDVQKAVNAYEHAMEPAAQPVIGEEPESDWLEEGETDLESEEMVVRGGNREILCRIIRFTYREREFGVFRPRSAHRLFVLRRVAENYWKPVQNPKLEEKLIAAYLDYELRERLGAEYEEL